MKTIKRKNGLGNKQELTEKKGFYISYADVSGVGGFSGDEKYETAIVANGNYYILNGDFRKEYAKCKTLAEAMKVFKKNKAYKSSWSN